MTNQTPPPKPSTILLILSWIFGALLGLVGVGTIFSEPIPGIALIIMGVVLLPPTKKWLMNAWKFNLSRGIKAGVIVVAVVAFGATVGTSNPTDLEDKPETLVNDDAQTETETEPKPVKEFTYLGKPISEECSSSCVEDFLNWPGEVKNFSFEACYILCEEERGEMGEGAETEEEKPTEEEHAEEIEPVVEEVQVPTPTPEPKEEVIQAKDLYNEYDSNEIAADEKYEGEEILVTGTIKEIGKDILDDMYVSLKTDNIIGSVQCMLADGETSKAAKLSAGQTITMRGENPDFLINVILRECVIE